METVDLNFRFNATGNAVPELRKAQTAVKRLDGQIQQSNARMRGFNNGITTMQANTRKFSMGALQQAGYQVGDYAVQVANGTSKMQAFGQQAPQFLQIFGPIGAIVGAGVAIFSAIGVAIEKTAEAAKEAKPEIVSLGAAFSRLEDINSASLSENLSRPAREATAEYATLLESMRQVAEGQRAAAVTQIMQNIAPTSEIDKIQRYLDDVNETVRILREGGADRTDPALQTALRVQSETLDALNSEKSIRETILSIQGATRSEAAQNLAAAMDTLKASGNLSDELRTQLVAYGDQIGVLSEVQSVIDAVDEATENASESASDFAEAMQRAANAVMNINVSAFAKLQALQAELRGRTRGLGDDQIRIMMAARRAEVAARESGVDSSAELAAVAAAAAEIERKTIAAENSLLSFNEVAVQTPSTLRQAATVVDKELSPAMKRLQSVQSAVSSSLESGLMSVVDGTKSVKDAFKSMAVEIIKELYRIFVVKQITGFISNAIGSIGGAPTTSPRPIARPSFAGGGYTGNGARAGGLDGKGGYMAMIHPRETVVDHTKGQSAGGVTVIQNITFGSGVSRAEVNAMLPKIVEATKAAVVDAKLRGGSYGRSFA